MAVNSGTFERRIFSVSVQSADVNVFIVFSFPSLRGALVLSPKQSSTQRECFAALFERENALLAMTN